LSFNRSSLDRVPPISRKEFTSRQKQLTEQVGKAGVDVFIAEPGGTTQYYANFSTHSWGLSERPFLLVVTEEEMFFLTPSFEVSRARLLNIPSESRVEFVPWEDGALIL
jgi:Xaa-Pro aminopeptidase